MSSSMPAALAAQGNPTSDSQAEAYFVRGGHGGGRPMQNAHRRGTGYVGGRGSYYGGGGTNRDSRAQNGNGQGHSAARGGKDRGGYVGGRGAQPNRGGRQNRFAPYAQGAGGAGPSNPTLQYLCQGLPYAFAKSRASVQHCLANNLCVGCGLVRIDGRCPRDCHLNPRQ